MMNSAAMDLLTGRSFPELAAAVKAVAAHTAVEWDRMVRDALPTADGLTMGQLRDDLPDLLQRVADALESNQRYETDRLSAMAPTHGAVRYDQGFKLNEMLIEFSILRSTLIQQIAVYLGRNLETPEVMALGAALDISFGRSIARFVDHLIRQLQAATEAQSKYLSFLSHDLRGGLNGVFLMIEVLKRELAGEERLAETVEDLDIMRRSLMETVATMDRFLHAERFRKGKVQVRPGDVGVRNLLEETAAHFAYQAKDKGVAVRVEMPCDCTIVSDKDLLLLILQNLVSNALKYTHSGTAVSIIGGCASDACRISVIDQGPGIAPEKLSELFHPFSRGDTHGQPGVGLGLSIAHQAAQYLKAKLWAESQPGSGATFIVELPLTNPSEIRP
jgi:signal transduction histidine kinase